MAKNQRFCSRRPHQSPVLLPQLHLLGMSKRYGEQRVIGTEGRGGKCALAFLVIPLCSRSPFWSPIVDATNDDWFGGRLSLLAGQCADGQRRPSADSATWVISLILHRTLVENRSCCDRTPRHSRCGPGHAIAARLTATLGHRTDSGVCSRRGPVVRSQCPKCEPH